MECRYRTECNLKVQLYHLINDYFFQNHYYSTNSILRLRAAGFEPI